MESDRAVDPAGLERLLEITGNDPEFLAELVETFLEDAVGQLEEMRRAVAAGSDADLVRPAHSLKTNSASVGAERLSSLCRSLEVDARLDAVDAAADRVAEAAEEFERVRTELIALQATR
jgi:HPt (histidine-containing phosphotransfer) domain-containing protein